MPQDSLPTLQIPLDLLVDGPTRPTAIAGQSVLRFSIPADYETLMAAPGLPSEVFAIQRLLTLTRSGIQVRASWHPAIATRAKISVSLFPLLAVLLSLQSARHHIEGKSAEEALEFTTEARKAIAKYRLTNDLFSLSQIVLCNDSRGQGRPPDLYDKASGAVARRENFETLVLDVLARHVPTEVQQTNAFKNAKALGVIVAELFENTDMHGRFDLSGKLLAPDAMRGLAFKRIKITKPSPKSSGHDHSAEIMDCMEVLIFDTGLGYYPSYTRRPIEPDTSLKEEWQVLHNCLERHYFPDVDDGRAGHRAMGLTEVLRSVQALRGRIEVRTGRLYAYRTFMDGDLQAQMEEVSSRFAHISWPRPRMLDVEKRYVAIPSSHDIVVGTAVRVVVPLS